jgi:hypothetical protein
MNDINKNNIFIKKAIHIHGDKYDYSKIDYKNNIEKITIICKIHGEFMQSPNKHLSNSGCKECGKNIKKNKLTTEKFIEKAIIVHNDKYDYSKVNYIDKKIKVIIICKIHGDFLQIPGYHLAKSGCQKCSKIKVTNINTFTINEFIEKANIIHKNNYDYSKVNYINWNTKIIIICKIHGDFLQTPHSHLQGATCKKCSYIKRGNLYRLTKDEFIEKANRIHNNNYDYSLIEYNNYDSKLKIKCKNGHEFIQSADGHLAGRGCNICCGFFVNTKIFIENANKIHNNKYDYSLVDYKSAFEPIKIICKIHDIFIQTPTQHLNTQGCYKCNIGYSKSQMEWIEFIMNKLKIHIQYKNNIGEYKILDSRYHADGYHNESNTILEFQGCFYHGCCECFPNRNDTNTVIKKTYKELYEKTIIKQKYCIDNGFNFLEIWECYWNYIKNNEDRIDKYIEYVKTKLCITI